MKTQSIDTHSKAESVLISLLRNAKPSTKFAQVRSLSQTTLSLSRRAIVRKNSDLSDTQHDILFVSYQYGENLAEKFRKYLEKKQNEKP